MGPIFRVLRIAGRALLASLLISQAAQAGPITFNTALPVAKGTGVFRLQYLLFRASGDSTALDRSVTVQAVPSVLAVGPTSRLTLFAIFPVQHNSIQVNTPMGRVTRSAGGIGDTTFLVRYTVYQLDRKGSTIRIAPFGGVKAPTGKSNESDRFGLLPKPLQLGSGSWDGLGGGTFTWQTFNWEFDADAGYRKNTEADAFRFGNQSFADASFQYRVWPRKLGAGVPHFLYAVLESNLIHQARNQMSGVPDANSGGTQWFVDPGLQFVTSRYAIEAIVQIPASQRLHGTALRSDYQVTVGFHFNFSLPGK